MKLANRLLLFSVGLIGVLMVVIVYLVVVRLYHRIRDERIAELSREARLVAAQWSGGSDPEALVRVASATLDGRVTLIDATGTIVADAELGGIPSGRVGTRARRPEVARAREASVGVGVGETSSGSGEELYVAVREPVGIARVAVNTGSLSHIFKQGRNDVLIAGVIALILASLLASLYARYVSKTIIELRDMARSLAEKDYKLKMPAYAPGEIGELAESLEELSVRLEALERVQREFVANVSHELRTPLTIAGGFALTLSKGDPPLEKRQAFAKSILANTRRMQRIVEALLDLSKVESGGWAPRLEQIELSSVVSEVLEDLQDTYNDKYVEVVEEIAPDASVISADRIAARQILGNLVQNALRHTSSGRITIFSEAAEMGTWVGVSDTGEGISPEHLPRIFDRFYRVDSARSRESGGTGLGLAVVKHMIEAHGGRATAESSPGRGTTMRVFFPARAARLRLTPAHGAAVAT